jgi:hypothetical protein
MLPAVKWHIFQERQNTWTNIIETPDQAENFKDRADKHANKQLRKIRYHQIKLPETTSNP